MIYLLNMRTQQSGGRVATPILLRKPRYSKEPDVQATELRGRGSLQTARNVLFLLHGFNNNGETGETKLLRWAHSLQKRMFESNSKTEKEDEWHFVAVTWPGDTPVINFTSYPFEGFDADISGNYLADFINDIFKTNHDVNLCLVTHSLGARVALEAAEKLYNRRWHSIAKLSVMAAAVDATCLGSNKQYKVAVEKQISELSVLFSKHDFVLKAAFPLGDLLQNFIFFWYDEKLCFSALGHSGPKESRKRKIITPDTVSCVTDANRLSKDLEYGHSDYIKYDKHRDSRHSKHLTLAEEWLVGFLNRESGE